MVFTMIDYRNSRFHKARPFATFTKISVSRIH